MQQLLIPGLKEPDIHTVIEYSEEEGAVLTVSYKGRPFDAASLDDDLSVRVLKSSVTDTSCFRDEDAEYPNRILLRIRAE